MSKNSRERYNLHVQTKSADKVREIAAMCNLSNTEVLTRMIDYACEHVTFRKSACYEMAFDNQHSMDCEVTFHT